MFLLLFSKKHRRLHKHLVLLYLQSNSKILVNAASMICCFYEHSFRFYGAMRCNAYLAYDFLPLFQFNDVYVL